MARRKKKSGRRRASRRGKVAKMPTTVKGVFKRQPLLVKGGVGLSVIEILTKPGVGGDPMVQIQAKQWGNFMKSVAANAQDLSSYKPVAYGAIGHYVAKQLGLKGL